MQRRAEVAQLTVEVASAGVDRERRSVHSLVIEILAERGIELEPRLGQPLSAQLVDDADVILAMTGHHAIDVAAQFREVKRKVFVLDHFVAAVPPRREFSDTDEWLEAIGRLARPYPSHPDIRDVPDPMGRDEASFRAVIDQLDALTADAAKLLEIAAS